MVQFNLLPEVKQEFIKARRLKRLVMLTSLAVSAVSLVVLLLFIATVDFVQKNSLKDLNSDIKSSTSKLAAVPNLNKILTVQNQLDTLTQLHDQKPATSQIFKYVSTITPADVTISKLSFDFTLDTMTIDGNAPSLDVVNAFTNTLKQTNYTSATVTQATKAFNSVVLATFGRDDKGATYGITLKFDPLIFSNTDKATLAVPTVTEGKDTQIFQKVGS